MALNNRDQAQIRDYLLGRLSDKQQQQIDERLMVEDELFDEFEVSKDGLIEDYCAGDLTGEERERFENRYLRSKEGRERHALALAMECVDGPAPAPADSEHDVAPQVEPRPAFFERVSAFFKAQPWAFATAASLALVVVVAVLIFLPGGRGPQVTIERTLASSVLVRGGNGPLPTKIQLPKNTGHVKLHLTLPEGTTNAARYQAVLDDRTNTTPVEVTEFNNEAVTVVIPRNKLPRGEYQLQLSSINADGKERALTGYYLFNIE